MSNVMCSSMTRMSLGCRHVRQQPQLQQTRPAFGFGCSMRGQALTCCPRAPVTVARAGILQVFAKQNSLRRQRTAERARLYNKSKKSAVKTRMKKVFKALTALAKESPTSEDAFKPVEQMINEAFEEIDKATGKGVIHQNNGARSKSRLSIAKKKVLIQTGIYTPAPAAT